jgi:16S rRNA G966 N2-methylase RsmD
MNKETKQFIAGHEKEDIFALKLKYKNTPGIDIELAIRQITGKQKIKSKVPLFYNTEDLLYPVQLSLEQSSSESTATYKSSLCLGNRLVDLTGGFGVDCCFMSGGFKQVTYVERQAELCELAVHNFHALGKDHIEVIHAETGNYLDTMEHADWIFIDPARRSTSGSKVVFLSDCEPNVLDLSKLLLEKASRVMIKLSPMMDISAALRDLPFTNEVHIISVENECKEVLLIMNQEVTEEIKVKTINLGLNKENQLFEFSFDDESIAESSYTSLVGKYLYEPNAAIMKSGAFRLIGERFKLQKLHINTHLYTSDELLVDFPGRIFEVTKQWGNSKNELKELITQTPKANITVRNYPVSVDELRKKLNIKDGGDYYLFACTLNNEQKSVIQCKKIKL